MIIRLLEQRPNEGEFEIYYDDVDAKTEGETCCVVFEARMP